MARRRRGRAGAPGRRVRLSLAACAALSLAACSSTWQQVGLGFRALTSRTGPDYEALEEHREGAAPVSPSARSAPAPGAPAWPGFRGPRRDGIVEDDAVEAALAGGLPSIAEVWRQPIGAGYASFAVAEGLAFTIEQRREREVVTAYDAATGAEVWEHGYEARFGEAFSGEGPRATPAWHAGSVYALGATGELRALDARTGALRWRRNVLEDTGARNLDYGLAASPLVAGSRLIVLSGEGESEGTVVAYDLETGSVEWRALSDAAAYASPALLELAGRRQVVVATAERFAGLDPEDGAVLWEHPWRVHGGIQCAQPILAAPDRLLITASYGAGAAVLELRDAGERLEARAVWEQRSLKSKFASPVVHEGHAYGFDEAILVCIDLATGERRWKAGRYGYGQLLGIGDRLVVLGEHGELCLVRATPERHDELARFQALEGTSWTPPAFAGTRILLRNAREMVCYDLRGAPGA